MQASSETVAGDDVADRQREEGDSAGHQDDVKHFGCSEAMKELAHKAGGVAPICGASLGATTCHRSHKDSRGMPSQSYRNPIKIGDATAALSRLNR